MLLLSAIKKDGSLANSENKRKLNKAHKLSSRPKSRAKVIDYYGLVLREILI